MRSFAGSRLNITYGRPLVPLLGTGGVVFIIALLIMPSGGCVHGERSTDGAALAVFYTGGKGRGENAALKERRRRKVLLEALEAEQLYVDMTAELAMGLGGPLTPGAVLDAVRPYLGVPYVWGGSTLQGLDCSGFTQLVFRRLGVRLPRTSREQARLGVSVAREALRPGDLVFFAVANDHIDHVAVMVGANRMAHSTGRRGRVVIEPFAGLYPGKFVVAKRLARKS